MVLSFTSIRPLEREESPAGPFLFVTAGTFQKRPFLAGADRKTMLLESLDFNAYKWGWRIVAYALLDNHYHLLLEPPVGDHWRLSHIIQCAHSYSAHHWRRDDPSIHSRIWWNFWETPVNGTEAVRRHIVFLHTNHRAHGISDAPATYPHSSLAAYRQLDEATIRSWEEHYPPTGLSIVDNF